MKISIFLYGPHIYMHYVYCVYSHSDYSVAIGDSPVKFGPSLSKILGPPLYMLDYANG
jgi:hypothetical protein